MVFIILSLSDVDNITTSNLINIYLPIKRMFKLFEYNQQVFKGMKHQIVLYKNLNNKEQFMMNSAAATLGTAQLNIVNMSWWVPVLLQLILKLTRV